MEPLQALQIIWFFLIGVLFIGYSVLDGFDLGIGITPSLSREREKGNGVPAYRHRAGMGRQ